MEHENPKRPSVKVENSEWTIYFIDPRPLPCSSQPITTIKNRRDELVRKVRCLIQEHIGDKNLLHGMKTVDALERLGIGYHFEQEIATFMDLLSSKLVRGDDLSTVALQFRLLRQHHYNVTCGSYILSLSSIGLVIL
uniref:Terpene synthase N-terminal domain-containing protein n=1 Tax=Arundo donax TaxID=35708 RepID=A0A0A8YZN9_ARUDO